MARSTSRSKRKHVAENMSAPASMAARSSTESMNGSYYVSEAPYSLNAMLRFFTDNAGLIFIALSIFIIGFLVGSLWTENRMLKSGYAGTGSALGVATGNAGLQAPSQPAQQPDAGPATLSDEDWKSVIANGAALIGDRNAKITIVEYTDYQCPFCGQFFKTTYPDLKKNYIDTGKVKLIVHDQPLPFHANARIGALAARCAGDQGGLLGTNKNKNYEAMHDALFSKQDEWVNLGKDAAIEKFGEYAKEGGMNPDQLKDCVKTEKFGKDVDADSQLGNKIGANGTPTFFIEKQPLVGAQPYASFQAALDAIK